MSVESDRAKPQDLGWRLSRPGATSADEPGVYETMRSFVDAQGDADLPRMRRLDAKLSALGWELVPEYGAAVYTAARERTARSDASFARFVASFPEGSTVRAELEKHMTPPRPTSDAERRRTFDAQAAQLEHEARYGT